MPPENIDSKSFVHLHVHTQYSLLQGAIWVDSLIDKVKELGMSSVAITDTHNLFGAVDFYQSAKKAGIKPIIGCEILYAPQGQNPSSAGQGTQTFPKFHHLVLLAKNYKGYQNLCKLISRAYIQAPAPQKGAPAGPKALIDRQMLSEYCEELVVLSGCLRGEIAYQILSGNEENAKTTIQWFKEKFKSDFYLELQDTQLAEQNHVNEVLYGFAQKMGIKTVATTDCHYLEPEHHEAHEVLQCIEHGRNLDLDRPPSLVPKEFYLKSAALMRERFERFEGSCDATLEIADKCNTEFKFKDDKGRAIYHLPDFRPSGIDRNSEFDTTAYFDAESYKGLENRFESFAFIEKRILPEWEDLKKIYRARLSEEIAMISKTGFSGYFLIVADFINWAKKNGIPVGPGRGSGAGSLVAYSLNITDIDPIEFKLLFERFINPERISMPDFDVDFCQERRGEVIDYVKAKYGSENVCQIITFGKLQARAVIRDVGRVLGLSFADTDQINKLLPDELNITIDMAIAKEPRLAERIENDPKVATVIRYARQLEGLSRNAGIHAAGIIITQEPVSNYCALYVGKDGAQVTQLDKDSAEAIGLIKFDFLGLKTLTVIDHAVKLIRQDKLSSDFDISRISLKDRAVFELISSGDTDGVFQIESDGMKDLCMRIKPNSLEDLTAINALYRPGPLGSGMVDDFIDRKHGRSQIVYDVESLTHILKETYGVILYQEQVMQIARELAGYSLGQADLLRRAMGKKKADEMAEHKEIFVKGAVERSLDPKKAESIFDLMAKFAEYGFNKSHSAAYGMITYQTAFLKTHFPAEFMAALMTTEMDNTDKITRYIGDARLHGLEVLSPDVNFSQKRFSVEMSKTQKKAVRFGLEAIKGVGSIAVDTIIEARQAAQFTNVLEFCKKVSTRKVNKKVLESLILAGALDSIAEVNRASLHASIEKLLEISHDEQEERELGQVSLFDQFKAEEIKMLVPNHIIFESMPDWPRSKRLNFEKQVVGFYVSGHPMDGWQTLCDTWLGWNIAKVKKFAEDKKDKKTPAPSQNADWGGEKRYSKPVRPEVRIAGMLGEGREILTKKGTRMAFCTIEDTYSKIDVVFFPDVFAQSEALFKQSQIENEPVLLTCEIEFAEEVPKLFAKSLGSLDQAQKGQIQGVTLKLVADSTTTEQLRELKKGLLEHRGRCPVKIEFRDKKFTASLASGVGVTPTPEMIEKVNKIFGNSIVHLN